MLRKFLYLDYLVDLLHDSKGVYVRFHFGRSEIFSIQCLWSISFNCLHEITRNETHFGCYFIVAILTEIKFHFGWKILCKYYPEIKLSKTKHLRLQMFHKNKYSRSKNQNKIEFHFNSPAVETNVDRIFFMPLASKDPTSDYQDIRKWVQNFKNLLILLV